MVSAFDNAEKEPNCVVIRGVRCRQNIFELRNDVVELVAATSLVVGDVGHEPHLGASAMSTLLTWNERLPFHYFRRSSPRLRVVNQLGASALRARRASVAHFFDDAAGAVDAAGGGAARTHSCAVSRNGETRTRDST